MTTNARSERVEAFEAAMTEAGRQLAAGDAQRAFSALERAHVLGQLDFLPHLRVHWHMLRVGWERRDRREVVGQAVESWVGAGLGKDIGVDGGAWPPQAASPNAISRRPARRIDIAPTNLPGLDERSLRVFCRID